MTIISIILVFGALVFFHELGHLILAKRAGILCREFAIGFGPKLFSFVRGETVYTLRLLPLGGFVRMAGEDPEVIEIKTGHDVGVIINAQDQVEKIILNHQKEYPEARIINVRKVDLEHDLVIEGYDIEDELVQYALHPQAKMIHHRQETQIAPYDRQFASKTLGQRASTIFAGPLANFLLAFFLLLGLAGIQGVPADEPIIGEVTEASPAEQSGLQTGDEVLSINNEPIASWVEMVQIIRENPGSELMLTVLRDGNQMELPITPVMDEVDNQVIGFIGVGVEREKGLLLSVEYGFNQTVEFAKLIFTGLGMLITGGLNLDDLAGPVGIFKYTGDAAQQGLGMLIVWTAILSVNLGIMNLLPIPALDGGRLIFIALEAIRGRPIDPQKEGVVHFIGFALLMLLILVVTWNDIQRLFN